MPKLTKKAIHHGRDGTNPNYRKALLLKMKRLTDYGEHSTFKRQGENMNCEKLLMIAIYITILIIIIIQNKKIKIVKTKRFVIENFLYNYDSCNSQVRF